jgi:hypothetical protein
MPKVESAVFQVDFAQDAKIQMWHPWVFQVDFAQDAKIPRAGCPAEPNKKFMPQHRSDVTTRIHNCTVAPGAF